MVLFNEMSHTKGGTGFSGVGNKSSDFTMLSLKCLLDIQMAMLRQLAIQM